MTAIRHIFTIIIIISAALASEICAAQDLKILSISDGSYPEIQVRARLVDQSDDSICISELNKPVEYTIQECEAIASAREGRMYVFLVENSYSFYKNDIFPAIKKSILSIGDNLGKYDNANIMYFGYPSGNARYLSAEQTSDLPILMQIAQYGFEPQTDSSYIDNRLISALQEALEYCNRHKRSMETVILTVISRGLNLDNTIRDFPADFKDRLQKSGIYLNVLMYRSESQNVKHEMENLARSTSGSFGEFSEADIEKSLVQSLEKMSKVKPRNLFREVMITFMAGQSGTRNSFTVKYGNTLARCEYTNPSKSGFLGKYPIAISVLMGLVMVLAAVVIYIKTKARIIKKIGNSTQTNFTELQRQNRILKQEIEKYKKHPLSMDHSFDNIYIEETLIGSGKIIPKLQIEDHGKHEVYKITKLSMTIGRNDGNDIVLENRTVSGRHATITVEGGEIFITDNESTNGLFVNDLRIITKQKLKSKDRIRIGSVMAQLIY